MSFRQRASDFFPEFFYCFWNYFFKIKFKDFSYLSFINYFLDYISPQIANFFLIIIPSDLAKIIRIIFHFGRQCTKNYHCVSQNECYDSDPWPAKICWFPVSAFLHHQRCYNAAASNFTFISNPNFWECGTCQCIRNLLLLIFNRFHPIITDPNQNLSANLFFSQTRVLNPRVNLNTRNSWPRKATERTHRLRKILKTRDRHIRRKTKIHPKKGRGNRKETKYSLELNLRLRQGNRRTYNTREIISRRP